MIRTARAADVPALHAMIRDLASYEKALDEVHLTEEQLHTALFGPHPAAFAHLAEDDTTGEPVGFALWFLNFSTWRGVHGIYLEDLYVRPEARGGGHGKALLRELPAPASSGATSAWSGRSSTGTSPRSASTRRWAPARRTSGRCTG